MRSQASHMQTVICPLSPSPPLPLSPFSPLLLSIVSPHRCHLYGSNVPGLWHRRQCPLTGLCFATYLLSILVSLAVHSTQAVLLIHTLSHPLSLLLSLPLSGPSVDLQQVVTRRVNMPYHFQRRSDIYRLESDFLPKKKK